MKVNMLEIINYVLFSLIILYSLPCMYYSSPSIIRRKGRRIIETESTGSLIRMARWQLRSRIVLILSLLAVILLIYIVYSLPQPLNGTFSGVLGTNASITGNISITQQFVPNQVAYGFLYFLYGGFVFLLLSQFPMKKSEVYGYICDKLLPAINKQLFIFDHTIHVDNMIKENRKQILDENNEEAIQNILREMKKMLS